MALSHTQCFNNGLRTIFCSELTKEMFDRGYFGIYLHITFGIIEHTFLYQNIKDIFLNDVAQYYVPRKQNIQIGK